jgi:hypothetical protein
VDDYITISAHNSISQTTEVSRWTLHCVKGDGGYIMERDEGIGTMHTV